MSEIDKTLKPLPYTVSKKQLMAIYLGQMTELQIRRGINSIILDNRKACNKYVQLVWHNELIEFVETYGLPKGYFNPNKEK